MINPSIISRLAIIWAPIFVTGIFLFQTFAEKDQGGGYELASHFTLQSTRAINKNETSAAKSVAQNTFQVLKRNPLDVEVLMQFLVSKLIIDPQSFDTDILNHVRLTNSRNRTALKLSLSQAMKTNDMSLALKETDILYRLERNFRDEYIKILSAISRTADGQSFINLKLEENPQWGGKFIFNEINLLSPEQLPLLKPTIDAYFLNLEDKSGTKNIVSGYARRLIDIGAYDLSLSFWKQYAEFDAEYPIQENAVFNPEFLDLVTAQPYNWKIYNTSAVSTEYNKPKGVFVRFNGKRPAVLLKQFMEWGPSKTMRLDIDFIHRYDNKRGQFYIELRCAGTHKLISSYDIIQSTSRQVDYLDVNVDDSNCDIAYVQLKARPGTFARPITLTLNHLDIQVQDVEPVKAEE